MSQQNSPDNQNSLTAQLELYKLYVEMADRVSARRAEMSKFYISLLTALLAIISIVIDKSLFASVQNVAFLTVALLGMLLCVTWIFNIQSYRQLNSIKYEIIQEMERKLPFACYSLEWDVFNKRTGGKKYLRLTSVEQIVPVLLAVPYFALFIYGITR